jgi:hypothetical protein
MAVALVVICVLAAVSLIGNHRGSATPTAHDDNPGVQTHVTTPPPATNPPVSPPPSAQALLPDDAIALIRVTSDRSWVSAYSFSGRLIFQGNLSAGQQKVFRDAKGLRLTIGNAPAVDLVANGRDVGAPRSQGNVAHITIAQGGAVQYA